MWDCQRQLSDIVSNNEAIWLGQIPNASDSALTGRLSVALTGPQQSVGRWRLGGGIAMNRHY
jgi:hypothetical protein